MQQEAREPRAERDRASQLYLWAGCCVKIRRLQPPPLDLTVALRALRIHPRLAAAGKDRCSSAHFSKHRLQLNLGYIGRAKVDADSKARTLNQEDVDQNVA